MCSPNWDCGNRNAAFLGQFEGDTLLVMCILASWLGISLWAPSEEADNGRSWIKKLDNGKKLCVARGRCEVSGRPWV